MSTNINEEIARRFWSKADCSGECWPWKAGVNSKGYGKFWVDSQYVYAHRYAYQLVVGDIADGLVIDHLCRNRRCVRPDHMEVVTNAENLRRGESFSAKNVRKTHCPEGHAYTSKNTHIARNGSRRCRTCRRLDWHRKWKHRKPDSAAIHAALVALGEVEE